MRTIIGFDRVAIEHRISINFSPDLKSSVRINDTAAIQTRAGNLSAARPAGSRSALDGLASLQRALIGSVAPRPGQCMAERVDRATGLPRHPGVGFGSVSGMSPRARAVAFCSPGAGMGRETKKVPLFSTQRNNRKIRYLNLHRRVLQCHAIRLPVEEMVMAKVKGPLMSMEASGSYGSTLVFGRRLGSNVVRQLVKPSNPQTQGQMDARNRVRVFGALQKFVSGTSLKLAGKTSTDKELIAALTPAGQRWNSYLQQVGIGSNGVAYTAARAAFALLTEQQKGAWDTAAGALTPVILGVAQKDAGGMAGTDISAGEVFFIYVYTLSLMGITATPTGTPPTYA